MRPGSLDWKSHRPRLAHTRGEKQGTTDKDYTEPEVTMQNDERVYSTNRIPPQALVIHCGDPRFQEAFKNFITDELGISNYTPIVTGGGIHALGMQSILPENFNVLWEQITFFIGAQRLTRVIVINHEDCLWYENMKRHHPEIERQVKGKLDLQTAVETIRQDFPLIEIRAFWAALEGDTITFSELTGNKLL